MKTKYVFFPYLTQCKENKTIVQELTMRNYVMGDFSKFGGENEQQMGKEYQTAIAIQIINEYMAENRMSPESYISKANELAAQQGTPTVTNTYLRNFLKGKYKNPGVETLKTILSPANVRVKLERDL